MVLAMGLENAVFQVDGGAGLGLTYITGALVKVGQLAAAALTGGARWGWLPNLLLWAALVAGAVAGAFAYRWINLAAIWFAAGTAWRWAALFSQQRSGGIDSERCLSELKAMTTEPKSPAPHA